MLGAGGVLFQIGPDNEHYHIMFFSINFNDIQRNWSTIE